MVKYNFIIHVSQSYNPERERRKREKFKLFSCICEYIKSFLHFLSRAKFVLLLFFFFSTAFPSMMNLARHPARGSIWGYFSAFHRATPWQAPLSSAIRYFYNESLFTGLSMRYLCYPILRLRASN